jgi:hypothetical protein
MPEVSAIATQHPAERGVSLSLPRRLFSFPVFLGALLLAGIFLGTHLEGTRGDTLFGEGDTWWHIRAGEEILRSRAWPHTETYSFTAAGTEWMAYEWMGEVAMALAYRAGGLVGLKLLSFTLSGGMFLLLYVYATRRSGSSKAAFVVCTAVLPVAVAFWTLRPQLLGYMLFLVTLICLEEFRRGRRVALWFLPPVFLAWANTHGTFIFGLAALGLAWFSGHLGFQCGVIVSVRRGDSETRRLAAVTLLSLLALGMTPYGTRLATVPLEMAFLQPTNIANIQEWMPLTAERFLGGVVLILLVAVLLSFLALRRTFRFEDLALLVLATFFAFLHLRFAVLFLLVAVPLLARALAGWLPAYDAKKDRPLLNAALMLLLLLGIVRYFPTEVQLEASRAEHFPVAAADYIERHSVAGPVFNDYSWGGYLAWVWGSHRRTFIDGRADVFEHAGTLADYLLITRLDATSLRLLDKYDIQACLIRRESPLATLLNAAAGWQRVYSDEVSAVYERREVRRYDFPRWEGAGSVSHFGSGDIFLSQGGTFAAKQVTKFEAVNANFFGTRSALCLGGKVVLRPLEREEDR